ncbi:RNA-directed DNA polymerase [Parabacteroides provencensis]|uniref:RNA-directed DNA polymerase n=1 Tax=Parabacteroides provencensis TaxID=1944636 RepID=UPI000C158488|nr:RNA-directed DNA polymerase [Parabacteroides provencensis]
MKIDFESLVEAWLDCRRAKRRTPVAMDFEVDAESNLYNLYKEIEEGTYKISRSNAFIVLQPVKREVFAASFRDRVVHHYLAARINPLFEKEFILDSYSCRVGKGTLFGVKRLKRFIAQCSANYTEDCYVLQCDIRGFFMNIDRRLLANKLNAFLKEKYKGDDMETILYLTNMIALDNPVSRVHVKGFRHLWKGLPKDKSLFSMNGMPMPCDKAPKQLDMFVCNKELGLPIGNLTSQLFANFYLNSFDHYCKSKLRLRYYGRYVDDFFVVHQDKDFLKSLVPVFQTFLRDELGLTLHPKKIRLTHYSKGVRFVGAIVKGRTIKTGKRAIKGMRKTIGEYNYKASRRPLSDDEEEHFLQSLNSYLGLMRHHNSFSLRKKVREWLSPALDKLYYFTPEKIVRKEKVRLLRHQAVRNICANIMRCQKKAGLVPGNYDDLYMEVYAARYNCPEILNHGFTY